MAYGSVTGIAPQYEDYPNHWLKFYDQGTTTPISMATDSTGNTLIARAELDQQGFIVTAGDARFIPFIDQAYDAWLFPTSADADNNDTANAIRLADNLEPSADAADLDAIELNIDEIESEIDSFIIDSFAAAKGGDWTGFDAVETRSFYGEWESTPEGMRGGALWFRDGTNGAPSTAGASGRNFYDAAGAGFTLASGQVVTAYTFGVLDDSDSTSQHNLYMDYVASTKSTYIEPEKALSTVNLLNSSMRNTERRRIGLDGIKALRDVIDDPARGIHFAGDSVMNGFITGGQIPGNARESFSWPNLLSYAMRRSNSGLATHDRTFNAPLGAGSTHGVFNDAPLGTMNDYNGFLDESIVLSSGGASVIYCTSSNIIEFDLPRGGVCDLHGLQLDGSAPVVNITISVNGSSFFAPVAADKFEIAGFPDPSVLDFSAAKAQHRILNLSYDDSAAVTVRFATTDTERFFFLTAVTRTDAAIIYNPHSNAISKNSFDIYSSEKICALPRKGSFNTITISYLADDNGLPISMKFINSLGLIVNPSTISGMVMHDQLGGGGSSDKDEIVTDSLVAGLSGVNKYICRSYFMVDKSDLSAAGVVGVILYHETQIIPLHDISFHGINNNEGVSGATTDSYASELSRITPYAKRGDIIMIGTGINDWGIQLSSSYLQQKAKFRTLALSLLATGATVVFMTNTQVRYTISTESTKNNRFIRFEDIQNAMVDAANSLGCPVIDWNAYNQDVTDWNSTYMADDLHPNRAGHLLIANAMISQLGLPEFESS
jgi:lysophospholipase L1-like esterase